MSRWKKIIGGLLAVVVLLGCQLPALAEETKTVALDVMLVVDDTVSMQSNDPNHIASSALLQFASSIPTVGSRVGMATYAAKILTQQPMLEVNSKADIDQLIGYAQNGLTQNGHYTDLPSALKYAVDQLQQLDERDNPQVVIAVSDGENDFATDADRQASDEALLEVLAADIPVYIIGINSSGSISQYLSGISEHTGGQAYFAESGDQVKDILNEISDNLYGYINDDSTEKEVGEKEESWAFALSDGIFECNVELRHSSDLTLRLEGPDGKEIPLNEENGIAVFKTSGGDGLHTVIKMLEPTGGNYTLYMRSSQGHTQTVLGQITLNNEIFVQVTPSASELSPGDGFSVQATLMRGNEEYTDLAFDRLQAVAEFNGQSVQLTAGSAGFQGNLTAPDNDGKYELTVTVSGKTFMRTSDPVKVVVEQSSAGVDSTVSNAPEKGFPWWILIIVVAVVVVIVVIVLLKLRGRQSGKGANIQLRGTLQVTYYRQPGMYTWEKYVAPGSYYSKRAPAVSLGKMLRDLHEAEEIPEELDGLLVSGEMAPDRQQYVVLSGEMSFGDEKQPVYSRLKIDTGMSGDDQFDSFSFEDSGKVSLLLPSGGTIEFRFLLG